MLAEAALFGKKDKANLDRTGEVSKHTVTGITRLIHGMGFPR